VLGAHHAPFTIPILRHGRFLNFIIYKAKRAMEVMEGLVLLGAAIVIVGFLVVFIASVLGSRSPEKEREQRTTVKGGGVILIGPIPIIFGTDAKWAVIAIVLAIVLVLVGLFAAGVL
jgi:uncharacterized protein (TIGR00304 family)